MMRRRLANAYVSTLISISLVLLLVGIASLLLVNARSVSDYFKENLQISVLMKADVSDDDAAGYQEVLDAMPYTRQTRFVSKEQGVEEMKEMLGEDFFSMFSSAPVPASIDITLNARYVEPDSIQVVRDKILESPLVDEVNYQQSLIEALNSNLRKIALVLGIFIVLLLFVSFVLINNTMRLNVFSRRFTIHTMKLVGATRSFIRAPFMWQSVILGFFSAVVAIAILLMLLFVVRSGFAQLLVVFKMDLLLAVMAIMIIAGIVICALSTFFGVNKLISLGKDELYY